MSCQVEDVPVTYSDLGWLTVDRYEQKMTFADDASGGTGGGVGDAAVSEGKSDGAAGSSTSSSSSAGAAQSSSSSAAGGASESPVVTLLDLVDDTDAACREETKEMYRNENKSNMLEGTTTGVPESLQTWLTEVTFIHLSTYLPSDLPT